MASAGVPDQEERNPHYGQGDLVGVLAATVLKAGYWALVAASAATALTRLILLWLACPWRPSRVREWKSGRISGARLFNVICHLLHSRKPHLAF